MSRILLLLIFLLTQSTSFSQSLSPEYLKTLPIRNIGPGAMSGRITALACNPQKPEIIYAGAASGGVWRSTNGGVRWSPIFDKAGTQSIGAIALNPNNPDEIWVGTGEGNPRNSQNFGAGVYKSTDGGKTWRCVGLQNTRTIHRIVLHRDNPNIAWVASLGSAYGPNPERGVFKTSDGGNTWRKVLFVNELSGCADLVADPENPNKLFAAIWEYKREPWFFNSGGQGSGLYVSLDGGESWERRSEADGLPKGPLGRIGLAVANSNPAVVYALVEAKENALYRSNDGGKSWNQLARKNMGDRPFYYCEIYVDPKDENTVYSVHSQITKSIDGGRTFDRWVGFWDIHPDHHAFWINPDNPKHIIEGNDGGINITYDGGTTWRYAENIPVGQFYHINVDDATPYNVYGGLQDNGSWVGPSAVWRVGGILNSDWQEVYFGDGFDVAPRPDDTRYLYAMAQGGNLAYIDRQTGRTKDIRPQSAEKKDLRFNWNAGFSLDPHQPKGLYYGSQYLHYSPDCGESWQIISPDLSTGDTSKLHQDKSGGLTIDATNAENYCTILCIAPSIQDQNTIWVGTDDGNLQLTRDGGKSWTNLSERLPDLPKNAWIPQIHLSAKNPGEAFVVVNNYRQNDFQPYLYHTKDYGKKWKRLASPKTVDGFCLSVVQDPEEPALLFLGTDLGLYISIDYGERWTHWPEEKYPRVPTQDMVIQAREADLVIGTFGRGIWVLDNIRPLREAARENGQCFEQPLKVFTPGQAIMAEMRSYQGPRFSADAMYYGDNESTALRIPVWVKPDLAAALKDKKSKKDEKKEAETPKKEEKKTDDKAIVLIIDAQGDTIRRYKTKLDTCFNMVYWGFDTKGVRMPSNNEPDQEQLEPGGGPRALPGTYTVKIHYGGHSDSTLATVVADPRLGESSPDLRARFEAYRNFQTTTVKRAAAAYERLKQMEKTIRLVEDQLVNVPDSTKKVVLDLGKALKDSIAVLKESFFQQKELKGIQRNPNNLQARLYDAFDYLRNGPAAPGPNGAIAVNRAMEEAEILIGRINVLSDQPWKNFREKAESLPYSLFKELEPIK